MKNKRDEPYLLSCVIALVLTLFLSGKFVMGEYLDISGEFERITSYIVLSEILFIVVQRYLLMIFRGYKKYFDNHETH